MSVSQLPSVPCCGAIFETPGRCRFAGMCHLPEGRVFISRGCPIHLSLRQCTNGGRVSPMDTVSRLEPWCGLCPIFHQGGLLPGGHSGRVTLGTTDVMGKGSMCCCIVVRHAGLKSCVLFQFSASGSRTLGWDSGELVGIQAASPSPHLRSSRAFTTLSSLLQQLSSHQPAGANLLSIQAELRQGDAASTTPKVPTFPNRRQRRKITAGTNHC